MMSSAKYLSLAVALMVAACSPQNDAPPPGDKKAAAPAAAPAVAPTPVSAIQVPNWGPRETPAGKGFNVQSNGNSAIWFEAKGIGTNTVEVWLGDTKLEHPVVDPEKGGSAEVPPALIAKPGKYPYYLVAKPSGTRVEIGTFEVKAN